MAIEAKPSAPLGLRTKETSTHLIKSAEMGVKAMQEAFDENHRLVDEIKDLNRANDKLASENDMLREQLDKAQREKDFYQRHSMRLVTRLNDIEIIIGQALQEAKDAAYAPTLAAPREPKIEVQINTDRLAKAIANISELTKDAPSTEVPAFLKEPLDRREGRP
jgi:hypothetical protein